jgi:hypothetical protein
MAFYMSRLDYPAECVIPPLRKAVSLAPECPLYRLGLAVACGRAGRWVEAYGACCQLPPAEVRCANCLNFMLRVFESMSDRGRWAACRDRLNELNELTTRGSAEPVVSPDMESP